LVTGVLTTTATQVATGGITSGSDIISDTDSTDSLGSTGVRWLKGWFDTLTAGTLTVGSGSVTDSSGAISFGDENLTTTGIVTAAGTSVFTNLDISGDIDVDGTTNLDVVDIDGALTQDGGAVFNEASADVDFRVESDNDANALFVQGSDGFVGIGTASPTEKLSVLGGHVSVGDTTGVGGTEFLLEGYREVSGGTKYGNTSIRTTYDISSNASDMLFYTASGGTTTTERLRIDSSGNVGIGESSPSSLLHLSSSAPTLQFSETDVGVENYIQASGGGFNFFADDTDAAAGTKMGFFIDGSELMRIDASGNLLAGCTSLPSASVKGSAFLQANDQGRLYVACNNTAARDLAYWINPNGVVGTITTTGSATAYNTSSDYRLKENITDANDAGDKIDAIKVRQYDWKADGSHQDYGMIAQELVEVAPEAVSAPEDPEEMMGVDYSKLVPMLVKEIQSLRNRVAQLEE
jgi:hypothetical protein